MASLAQYDKQPKTNKKQPINWTPYLFLAIPLLIYFVWIIAPTFYTFYLSFTDWDGIETPQVYGIQIEKRPLLYNYERLMRPNDDFQLFSQDEPELFKFDRDFQEAIYNNVRWLLLFITVRQPQGLD